MKMQMVGSRFPAGQLAMIEIEAEKVGQSAGQWIRDAALEKIRGQAENERLLMQTQQIAEMLKNLEKRLIDELNAV